MLNMELEEQKGEPEKEVFRIVKFQKTKPKDLCLTDIVLHVELYNMKTESFFKATFDDPAKIVADHKVPMDIIIYTLEEILSGHTNKLAVSYENNDGKETLVIMTAIDSKIFNKTLTFHFTYKFQLAKMSLEERIDMRCGIIEQKLKDQEIEKGDSRLVTIEEKLKDQDDTKWPMWFMPGKRVMEARFDITNNNLYTLMDNGKTLEHTGSNDSWNTAALTTRMNTTTAYRVRYRVASLTFGYMMFGVISSNYSRWQSCPDNGTYGWVAYFHTSKLQSSFQQNGSFANAGGPSPFAGSIVTVEYYPTQGCIQYFVNSAPAGQHTGCSFNNGDCRFSVATRTKGTKLRLLSLEQIQAVF